MTRCKHCLNKGQFEDHCCPVCGISTDKSRADLSPNEKRVRFFARSIRVLAMLHLIGSAMGVIMVFTAGLPFTFIFFALLNIPLAFGLAGFKFWGYRFATIYYFLVGMVNVISIQQGVEVLAGLFFALLSLYLVGNRFSKAIFERNTRELT